MGNPTEVGAKRSGHDHAVKIQYDFGDNLDEAIEKFGAEVIFTKFKQSSIVDLQSVARRLMFKEEGEGDNATLVPVDSDEVQAEIEKMEWAPGSTTRVIKTPKEKALTALKGMSPEEIQAILADLEGGDEAEG